MPVNVSATKPTAETEDHLSLKDTLANATNAQIDSYINTNITDLASAKTFLKKLTRIVRTLAKRAK
jgi:hypothetical protein